MIRLALFLTDVWPHWKVTVAAAFTAIAAIAANVVPPEPAWENLTWKGILLLAIGLLWKTWQDDRKAHKADIIALRDRHEEFLKSVIKENTESNRAVVAGISRQVEYFERITQKVVDERITQQNRPIIKP